MIFIFRIKVKDIDCPVKVIIKKTNKHIYLRDRDNTIVITSRCNLTLEFINNMVLKHYDAIYKSLTKTSPTLNELHYFGKKYSLDVVLSQSNNVEVLEDRIVIFTKKKEESYIQKIMSLFYAKELSNFVEKNLENIKNIFNIKFPITIVYKDVKTYFGSCYFRRKQINFATKLCKYDPIYIMSVIYHEMAHFYYPNHSTKFYALLEQKFPNYKKIHKNLKKITYNDLY